MLYVYWIGTKFDLPYKINYRLSSGMLLVTLDVRYVFSSWSPGESKRSGCESETDWRRYIRLLPLRNDIVIVILHYDTEAQLIYGLLILTPLRCECHHHLISLSVHGELLNWDAGCCEVTLPTVQMTGNSPQVSGARTRPSRSRHTPIIFTFILAWKQFHPSLLPLKAYSVRRVLALLHWDVSHTPYCDLINWIVTL